MKFTTAAEGMIPALKRLWSECFGDGSRYVDYIFTHLIRPENAFVLASRGKDARIPAMLFVTPFELALGKETAPGAYTFGVGTALEHRGKGLSTLLLQEAHRELAARGYALSVLVPAETGLWEFYGKRGYAPFSLSRRVSLSDREAGAAHPCRAEPAGLGELYHLRERYFAGNGAFVRWPAEYLRYVGAEYAAFGGETLLFDFGGRQGYCALYRKGDSVFVKELACLPGDFHSAARALRCRYGALEYDFSLRADFLSGHPHTDLPYSMIKWYDMGRRRMQDHGLRPPYIAFALD